MKKRINESQLRQIVTESVKRVLMENYNFASEKPSYDINSDEWKNNYDKMSNDYYNDNDLTDLQINHFNGKKGADNYVTAKLPKHKKQTKKNRPESLQTIISNGLRRLNNGMTPEESFLDFKKFNKEEKQYMKNHYMLSDNDIPVGTVYGKTFMVIYDSDKNEYSIPMEPLEL